MSRKRSNKKSNKMGLTKEKKKINILYSDSIGNSNSLQGFFSERGYSATPVHMIEKADLLVLEGGADINPTLYNENKHERTGVSFNSKERDKKEMALVTNALCQGVPILGICRGFQLLSVYAGGKLVQDVSHSNGHFVETSIGASRLWVNSLHHQMVLLDSLKETIDYVTLAWAKNLSPYHLNGDGKEIAFESDIKEIEAAYFTGLAALGVQWHPEWLSANSPTNEWLFNVMQLYNII